MIPEVKADIKVQTNIGGQKIAMSFDENSLVHIMSVLTDLYSDPEMAIIREYSTNAYDAHIEAGINRPIEVYTPTQLSSFLRIKDYGVGLSVEDIHDIYSKYGASTKRNTNEQSGILGLGCKSALTYTNQFTLSSVKNGWRVQALISRDEEGSGSIDVVSYEKTTDLSGTEILIPVKYAYDLKEKTIEFFRFWKPGTILLDGVEPKFIEGDWIDDDKTILLTKANQTHFHYIIMGNVPYPVEIEELTYRNDVGIIAFVEMGAVDFTPSRESLYMSKKTKDTLLKVKNIYNENLKKTIQKTVDSTPTYLEAFEKLLTWKDNLSTRGYNPTFTTPPFLKEITYKGEKIPNAYDLVHFHEKNKDGNYEIGLISEINHYGKSKSNLIAGSSLINLKDETLIVTGYTSGSVGAIKIKKAQEYWKLKVNPLGPYLLRRVIWLNNDTSSPWFDTLPRVKYEDLKKIPVPSGNLNTGYYSYKTISGSYPAYVDGAWINEVAADKIDTKLPIYWFLTQFKNVKNKYVDILSLSNSKFTLVQLDANRVNKFNKDFSTAVDIKEVLDVELKKWEASLTEDDIKAFYLQRYSSYDTLKRIDSNRIKDPRFKTLESLLYTDTTDIKNKFDLFRRVSRSTLKIDKEVQIFENNYDFVDFILKDYPLFKQGDLCVSHHTKNVKHIKKIEDHIYMYINTIYENEISLKEEGLNAV